MTALVAATMDQPACVRAWPPIAEPSATPNRMADALGERRASARSGAVATMRDCCGVIYDQPDKLQMTTITPKVTGPTGAMTIVGNKTICARQGQTKGRGAQRRPGEKPPMKFPNTAATPKSTKYAATPSRPNP